MFSQFLTVLRHVAGAAVDNLLKFASVLDKLRINAFDVFNQQVILWELPLAASRAVFLHRCRAARIPVPESCLPSRKVWPQAIVQCLGGNPD